MDTEWQQLSGDINVAEYGGLFGELDVHSAGTRYGVYIVEVLNMEDACGSGWNTEREGGALVTESGYVDVDGMELSRMRSIMDICGWASRVSDDAPKMPYSLAKKLAYARMVARDLRKLAAWEHRHLRTAENERIKVLSEEAETLRRWYSIPVMARAEMAWSYGGYSDGQSLVFKTLEEALKYHGIPQSALWSANK